MKKRDLIFSVWSMIVCLACLCSFTFAWFHDSASTVQSSIKMAKYSLTVSGNHTATLTEPYVYFCPLAEDDAHVFTLSAEGSSAETGYCKIEVIDQSGASAVYYTTQIFRSNGDGNRLTSMTLTVQAAKGCTIMFTPQWGTSVNYSVAENTVYGDNSVIIYSQTPYETYCVEEGITLREIAEHYQVSEEDILVYNGITESDIAAGVTIRIPGTAVTDPPVVTAAVEEEETEEAQTEQESAELVMEEPAEPTTEEMMEPTTEDVTVPTTEEETSSVEGESTFEEITSEESTSEEMTEETTEETTESTAEVPAEPTAEETISEIPAEPAVQADTETTSEDAEVLTE